MTPDFLPPLPTYMDEHNPADTSKAVWINGDSIRLDCEVLYNMLEYVELGIDLETRHWWNTKFPSAYWSDWSVVARINILRFQAGICSNAEQVCEALTYVYKIPPRETIKLSSGLLHSLAMVAKVTSLRPISVWTISSENVPSAASLLERTIPSDFWSTVSALPHINEFLRDQERAEATTAREFRRAEMVMNKWKKKVARKQG